MKIGQSVSYVGKKNIEHLALHCQTLEKQRLRFLTEIKGSVTHLIAITKLKIKSRKKTKRYSNYAFKSN